MAQDSRARGDQILSDSHKVESEKAKTKRSGSRGHKSRIERLTAQRHSIWRERNPRRYGEEREDVLSEDELTARDTTRAIRTQRIAEALDKAYVAKANRAVGR